MFSLFMFANRQAKQAGTIDALIQPVKATLLSVVLQTVILVVSLLTVCKWYLIKGT